MKKKYDIVTIGLQVIDLVVSSVPFDIFTRELAEADSIEMLLGGDAMNQALTTASLGSNTVLMGTVGNDRLGESLMAQLEKMPLTAANKKIDAPTAISIVMIDDNRERHFVYQLGHNEYLSYEHLDEEILKDTKIVSIGGFMALDSLNEDGMIQLLRFAKENGATTIVDCRVTRSNYNMKKIREVLSLTDYLLPSEIEAAFLTGESKDPVLMAQKLHKLGAKNCIIKLGSKGSYISAEGIQKMIPACPCNCIDTTGAGDSFTGAFCYGQTQDWDLETCVKFANAAGSITVEHIGANGAIKNVQQVLDRMSRMDTNNL